MDCQWGGPKYGIKWHHNSPFCGNFSNSPLAFSHACSWHSTYEGKHNKERSILTHIEVQQYIEQTYYSTVKIYTDGSKDPESGFTAAAVYIPQFKVKISQSISDQISVFTTEIIAIFIALQWIEKVQPIRSVIWPICTLSVLNS